MRYVTQASNIKLTVAVFHHLVELLIVQPQLQADQDLFELGCVELAAVVRVCRHEQLHESILADSSRVGLRRLP